MNHGIASQEPPAIKNIHPKEITKSPAWICLEQTKAIKLMVYPLRTKEITEETTPSQRLQRWIFAKSLAQDVLSSLTLHLGGVRQAPADLLVLGAGVENEENHMTQRWIENLHMT